MSLIGYTLYSVKNQKFKRIQSELSKKDAFKLGMALCNRYDYMYLEKEYEKVGHGASTYGKTIGFYTKEYGEIHKKGNKFIFQLYDKDGFIKSTYLLQDDGSLTNRR